jgi:Transposase DDE domain
MKRLKLMDLYTDFLTSSPNIASALFFAKMLKDQYSHDSITRMLAQPELDQKAYWKSIKKIVRRIEIDDGVISIDDFIEHKPHSTENDLICYHYDHCSGQSVKGINIVSFTYVNREVEPKIKLPIGFELIRKDQIVTKMVKDKRSGKFVEKTSRQASIGKNELLRSRLKTLTHQNNVRFRYVAFDTWYSSSENMNFIVQDLKKDFVSAIKDNRLISFEVDKEAKQQQWLSVSKAEIEPNCPYRIKLKKVPFTLILMKKVYKNLNGTVGVQYLVSSDTELDADTLSAIYKDRWSSEDVHRSLKQNAALEKMPAKMERSQANHIFASMIAQTKLECIKIATKKNHYALKRNILIEALRMAWLQIQKFKELCIEKSIHFPNFITA